MDRFIARANIDRFLDVLTDADLQAERRTVVTELFIEEMNKLAYDLEQLEFAQIRAAKNGVRLNHVRNMRDGLASGSTEAKPHSDYSRTSSVFKACSRVSVSRRASG